MNTATLRHRLARFVVVVCGGVSLAVAVGVAAFPSSARGAVASVQAAAVAGAAASGGAWGDMEEVPGIAALNRDGFAQFAGVSCASAGNCSAGGTYEEYSGAMQGFVVNETNDTWRTAEEVPGLAALNVAGQAQVSAVSCAAPRNCSAVGVYATGLKGEVPETQAFVANEANGSWGKAREVPGTAALNQGVNAQVTSVSCAAVGNCSVGGSYTDSSGHQQAFVANESNGTWRTAREVRGTAALNQGGNAAVTSVSCASAGNCAAGGTYTDSSGYQQAFLVNETNGTWRMATEMPGLTPLNQFGPATNTVQVSCPSPGNCAAGGGLGVVDETNGAWGTAEEVPGLAALNSNLAAINSVSCGSAGNCSAGGDYTTPTAYEAFVVNESNGTWGKAEEVPGTAALNKARWAGVSSVSCASAGNCSAGGTYASAYYAPDGEYNFQAFVVAEVNGRWRTAFKVPGSKALNQDAQAGLNSVSCASAGECSAGGVYAGIDGFEAFVVTQT
jgi:hypothetical protein